MEAVLRLLLLLTSLTSTSAAVQVLVDPPVSQFFKYSSFHLSCVDGQEQEVRGWTLMKRTKDEVGPAGDVCCVQACGSSCEVTRAFPATDSGQYWCESGTGTSNPVNISVTAGVVLLDAPVHPVLQGQDVSLACRCDRSDRSCGANSTFYKDGVPQRRGGAGVLSLLNVSGSDAGFYACGLNGSGTSPRSWLQVQRPTAQEEEPCASVLPPTGQQPPAPPPGLLLLRPLLVGTPLLLSTVLLGLIHRDRARRRSTARPTDVVMETAT